MTASSLRLACSDTFLDEDSILAPQDAVEAFALQNAAQTGGFISAVPTNFTGRTQPGLASGPQQQTSLAAQAAQASASAGVSGANPGQSALPRAFNITGYRRPNQAAPPSVDEVNEAAPNVTFPSGFTVRPHLAVQPNGLQPSQAGSNVQGQPAVTYLTPPAQQSASQSVGGGVPSSIKSANSGDMSSSVVGTQTASASVDALPRHAPLGAVV